MLHLDLRSAVDDPRADNFSTLLFRLILKADGNNRIKLGKGYPVEVEMANIFQKECPYKDVPCDGALQEPDWEAIETLARQRMGVVH